MQRIGTLWALWWLRAAKIVLHSNLRGEQKPDKMSGFFCSKKFENGKKTPKIPSKKLTEKQDHLLTKVHSKSYHIFYILYLGRI